MTNLFKSIASVQLLLIFAAFTSLQAQTTYFAGASSGTGNTGSYVTGIGFSTLNSSNSGTANTALGASALGKNTAGSYNTGLGYTAVYNNTTGTGNTGTGSFALYYNSTGSYNTANGYAAAYNNATGTNNVGVGSFALYLNTSGSQNIAIGRDALYSNTNGNQNTAAGYLSLRSNISGSKNAAYGDSTLFSNSTGTENTAIGSRALRNTVYSNNTAVGSSALYSNTTGYDNVAIGSNALRLSAQNASNTAVGYESLSFLNYGGSNTALGMQAMRDKKYAIGDVAVGQGAGTAFDSSTYCVFIGYSANQYRYTITNAMALGANTYVDASNKVVIGNTSVTSIGGQVGWTTYSDQRLKTNINKSNLGLDFILSLNPVTYNYKAAGQKGILYTGLIAQEVDAAAKKAGVEFSGVDKNGEYWGIRYAELTVPLIKSMQELNDKTQSENEALKTRIEKLETAIALLEQGIKPSTVLSASVLFQNQPNPFNNATTVNFILSSSDKNAAIVIRNMNGEVVKQVNNLQAGKGSIIVNASELAGGTYTYSLITNGNTVDTKLMVITK